jgi:hypothetical protein
MWIKNVDSKSMVKNVDLEMGLHEFDHDLWTLM